MYTIYLCSKWILMVLFFVGAKIDRRTQESQLFERQKILSNKYHGKINCYTATRKTIDTPSCFMLKRVFDFSTQVAQKHEHLIYSIQTACNEVKYAHDVPDLVFCEQIFYKRESHVMK